MFTQSFRHSDNNGDQHDRQADLKLFCKKQAHAQTACILNEVGTGTM